MLNDNSNTVVLERPDSENFVQKWQLACQGNIAHVVVMPNVTKEKILVFVRDLVASQQEMQRLTPKCVKEHIGPHCLCAVCVTPQKNAEVAHA